MTGEGKLVSTIGVAMLLAIGATLPATAGKIDRTPVGVSHPPSPASEDVLFDDDFSSENWNVVTDDRKSITYEGEALSIEVFRPEYFIWTRPNSTIYKDIHVEATIANKQGSDAQTAFGFLCHQQADDNDNFYYFAVTPTGEYAIARAAEGKNDVFLTNNDKWATSDLIARNAQSYRVGADCANGELTLYVDGTQIASASDSTYTQGSTGLIVWSATDAKKTAVTVDDFEVTQLR
jgi:hypothetical protein